MNNKTNLNNTQTVADIASDTVATTNNRKLVGKLELLEERAVVNKERLDVGKVIVRKEVRTKTVQVPIELVEEVLVISTEYFDADSKELLTGTYDNEDIIRHISPSLEGVTSINVNGKKVELGTEPVEMSLSRQVAIIKKETHVVQDVNVTKSVHTHADTIEVDLKREELDVVEEGFLDHETRTR